MEINKHLINSFINNADKKSLVLGIKEVIKFISVNEPYNFEKLINNFINIISTGKIITEADKYEPMSLDEAIEHCKEKSCGNNACALEHKQLGKWLTELKKLKEKNLAWSEEDERMIASIIGHLERQKNYQLNATNLEQCQDWLKSIKDRVQPKQEWSKEDEKIISEAEDWLDTLCDYLRDGSSAYIPDVRVVISKLKSLKDRYNWKPSKGQIEALEYHINHNLIDKGGVFGSKVVELLNQLKEL